MSEILLERNILENIGMGLIWRKMMTQGRKMIPRRMKKVHLRPMVHRRSELWIEVHICGFFLIFYDVLRTNERKRSGTKTSE